MPSSKVGGECVVGVVDLDDEDRAARGLDALGHAVGRAEDGDVAHEEMPVGHLVEDDLAAGSDDVHLVARGRARAHALPTPSWAVVIQRVNWSSSRVDVAHAVATAHEAAGVGW